VLTSIRARLGAVFIGFLLLGAGSVTATFVTVADQAADAVLINLAGRQRMLTQQMTKAVLGIARGPAADYQAELREAAYQFDRTLTALLDGGATVYGGESVTLPAAGNTTIRAQLEVVARLWGEFQKELDTVQTVVPDSAAFVQAVREIETISPVILQAMDQAVQGYEAAAKLKHSRLYVIQALFSLGAMGLLSAGYLLTQRTIVNPMSALETATGRIAGGDLESPVAVDPAASSEVRALAQSFEAMRRELAASRTELERWAGELEERVARRTEQLGALFEVTAEMSSALEIQRVLESIVEKARGLTGGEVTVLCLSDPRDQSLTITASRGSAQALVAPPDAIVGGLTLDLACIMEAGPTHEARECPLLRPSFRRSHLAVPLRTGNRVLGVLCVGHRDESRFGEEAKSLLTLLANAGAIALENARLYEQAEQAATLAERERLVAEIHDGLGQTLGYLGLRLGSAEQLIEAEDLPGVLEQLGEMQRTAQQASHEVQRLLVGLQASPHGRTLEDLLGRTVERFAAERGMEIELQMESAESLRSASKVHEQVAWVVQEALRNAHRHAPSSRVAVTLRQHGGQAMVSIRDDGPGFDVAAPLREQYHFGLKVMKTRAERIGGELSVESAPGEGTTVTLCWPTAQV